MYIRTKDGRVYNLESKEVSSWEYIDNDTAINEYGVECAFYTIYYFDENKGHYSEYDGKGGRSCIFIEEKDILKQSDTIEKLCDEFVIENNYYGQVSQSRYYDYEVAKQNLDIASNDVIYGAIRVAGKGLIYVAKMNEDGNLELL